MKSFVKNAVGLLVAVTICSGITVASSLGMFSKVEKNFYEPARIKTIRNKLDAVAERSDEYISNVLKKIGPEEGGFLSNDAVSSYFEREPSREVGRLFGRLLDELPGLDGLRVIERTGKSVQYSSYKNDSKKERGNKTYSNYGELKTYSGGNELPYAVITAFPENDLDSDDSEEFDDAESDFELESELEHQVQNSEIAEDNGNSVNVEDSGSAKKSTESRAGKDSKKSLDVEISKYRIIHDGYNQRLIISYPYYYNDRSYSMVFYINPIDFITKIVEERLISINDQLTLISSDDGSMGGFVFRMPKVGQGILAREILRRWKIKSYGPDEVAATAKVQIVGVTAGSDGEKTQKEEQRYVSWNLISSDKARFVQVGGLYSWNMLVMPYYIRILLLICSFITVCLIVVILFNIRKDDDVVILSKIKSVQIGLLNEYFEKNVDRSKVAALIESQKDALTAKIKKSLGRRGKRYGDDLSIILNQSWQDIINILSGDNSMSIQGLSTNDMTEIRKMFEDLMANSSLRIQAVTQFPSRQMPKHKKLESTNIPLGVEIAPSESQKKHPIPAEKVEDLEEVAPAEEVEELEDAEPVEDLEEVESAEEVEELEDAEPVEDLEEVAPAEEVEELEDAEPVEDLEEVAPAEEVPVADESDDDLLEKFAPEADADLLKVDLTDSEPTPVAASISEPAPMEEIAGFDMEEELKLADLDDFAESNIIPIRETENDIAAPQLIKENIEPIVEIKKVKKFDVSAQIPAVKKMEAVSPDIFLSQEEISTSIEIAERLNENKKVEELEKNTSEEIQSSIMELQKSENIDIDGFVDDHDSLIFSSPRNEVARFEGTEPLLIGDFIKSEEDAISENEENSVADNFVVYNTINIFDEENANVFSEQSEIHKASDEDEKKNDSNDNFEELTEYDDIEDVESIPDTEDDFMFTTFAANDNNITELPVEAIVQGADGVYSISENLVTSNVVINEEFQRLVNAVLR